VEDIYQTMVEAIQNRTLKSAMEDLKKKEPLPMHTMLDKQPREEAIEKRRARDTMELADVPPTNPGT
jgi:hypothetical protein